MKYSVMIPLAAIVCSSLCANVFSAIESNIENENTSQKSKEIVVLGVKQKGAVLKVSPQSVITAEAVKAINVTTIENFLDYEPSLIVRRRFIGDANGTIGIRGSNMFQTARTSVYADGVPLHNHLLTRWNGSPRWSLVTPDEVEKVEVFYGPFSAAYSGNSMGGVVNITTKIPEEQHLRIRGALFNQSYSRLGKSDDYFGGRGSIAYENRFKDLGVSLFYSHLENEGQPQSHYTLSRFKEKQGFSVADFDANATEAFGGVSSKDRKGADSVIYAESGAAVATTDLYKIKMTYPLGDFQVKGIIAREVRDGETRPSNFLVDQGGEAFWNENVLYNGERYTVKKSRLSHTDRHRETQLMALGFIGPVQNTAWTLDVNLSDFRILKDVSVSGGSNPLDTNFDVTEYSRSEYDNTGWQTRDINISTQSLAGNSDMSLMLGGHFSHYKLGLYSQDYEQGQPKTELSGSGGETTTKAIFAEYGWDITPWLDIALGARLESWQASNGFKGTDSSEVFAPRLGKGVSPKFSLGFTPNQDWAIRYSAAKALRFPIVEELYQNESKSDAVIEGDISLTPERGLHHNISIERALGEGYSKINLFQETIEDVIFSFRGTITKEGKDEGKDITTFLGVDEVETSGVEWSLFTPSLLNGHTDIRWNVSFIHSEITKNELNPSYVGKKFPRIPQWKFNALLTQHFSEKVLASIGFRYASNSYGQLDNSDTEAEVYGAHDDFLFVNLKARWQVNKSGSLALGIDNVNNDVAYIAHPWPARTVYLEGGYDF